MAIGDAISVTLGTAETDRQPASGVEEQISACITNGSTDASAIYNGSVVQMFMDSGVRTHLSDPASTAVGRRNFYNMALMITEHVYLRKVGTTDTNTFCGVQTNA